MSGNANSTVLVTLRGEFLLIIVFFVRKIMITIMNNWAHFVIKRVQFFTKSDLRRLLRVHRESFQEDITISRTSNILSGNCKLY